MLFQSYHLFISGPRPLVQKVPIPSWGPLIPIGAEMEAFKAETAVGMGEKENIADEETKSHWHKEEREEIKDTTPTVAILPDSQ